MASKRCSEDKPELIALFRLEFYKNKKKWKLCSEKAASRKKSSSNTSAERNNVNESYDLATKSEQKATVVEEDTLTPPTKLDELPNVVESPTTTKPVPLLPEEIPTVTAPYSLTTSPETNKAPLVYTQPCIKQGQQIWHQQPPISPQQIPENTWNNKDEINNNQWSQNTNTVNWKSPLQSEAYLPIFQDQHAFPFKSCSVPSKPNIPNSDQFAWKKYNQTNLPQPVLPSFSTILPSNNRNLLQERTWVYSESAKASSKQTLYCESDIPQGPSDCLRKLLCPNAFQNTSKNYSQNSTVPKTNLNLNMKQNLYYEKPDEKGFVNQTYHQNLYNYSQQTVPGNILLGSWSKGIDGPQLTCHKDIDLGLPKRLQGFPVTASKLNAPISNNTEIPVRRNLKSEFWTSEASGCPQNKPDIWINPALVANTVNTSWEQQFWQQQEDWRQNCEQARPNVSVEVDQTWLQDTEETTLTPHNKYADALSDARRETQECLRKLILAYREKESLDRWSVDIAERGTGHSQDILSESAEFIIGAKYVPHSSEKDPDDTSEFELTYMNATLGESPVPLSSANELYVATVLGHLLVDQQRKEQEKNRPIVNQFEYPTRDTVPCGGEVILDGSHLPHSIALLEGGAATNGLIKINMGRPYRL